MRWLSWMTGGSLVAIAVLAFAPSCGGSKNGDGGFSPDGSTYGEGGGSGSSGGVNEVGTFGGDTGTNRGLRAEVLGGPAQRDRLQRQRRHGVPRGPGVLGDLVRPGVRQRRRQQEHLRLRVLRGGPRRHLGRAGRVLRDVHREHVDVAREHHRRLGRTDHQRRHRAPSSRTAAAPHSPTSRSAAPRLQPGQVAILFLNDWNNGQPPSPPLNFACPAGVAPAFTTTDGAVHGTAMGKAFHVKTDRPVVAYDIFPFGGGQSAATSGTLLVPTSAWDVNYIAVNAYAQSQLAAVDGAAPSLDIVASQPNTTVTISPVAAITGGTGVAARREGNAHEVRPREPGRLRPVLAARGADGHAHPRRQARRRVGRGVVPQHRRQHVLLRLRAPGALPGQDAGPRVRPGALPRPLQRRRREHAVAFVGAVAGTTLTYEPDRRRTARPRPSASGSSSQFNTIAALRRAQPGRRAPLLHLGAHDGRRHGEPRPGRTAAGTPSSST